MTSKNCESTSYRLQPGDRFNLIFGRGPAPKVKITTDGGTVMEFAPISGQEINIVAGNDSLQIDLNPRDEDYKGLELVG